MPSNVVRYRAIVPSSVGASTAMSTRGAVSNKDFGSTYLHLGPIVSTFSIVACFPCSSFFWWFSRRSSARQRRSSSRCLSRFCHRRLCRWHFRRSSTSPGASHGNPRADFNRVVQLMQRCCAPCLRPVDHTNILCPNRWHLCRLSYFDSPVECVVMGYGTMLFHQKESVPNCTCCRTHVVTTLPSSAPKSWLHAKRMSRPSSMSQVHVSRF